MFKRWYVALLIVIVITSGCVGEKNASQNRNNESLSPTHVAPTITKAGTLSRHSGGLNSPLNITSWAYWLQNASPEEIAKGGFKLIVIDYSRDGSDDGAYSREEIESIKHAGKIPIAYISIGEAEDYRFYWNESWFENPPDWLGPENPDWEGNYAVKYWDERWKRIVFAYLDRIISQGFSGVYLDKVDEFEYWVRHGRSPVAAG